MGRLPNLKFTAPLVSRIIELEREVEERKRQALLSPSDLCAETHLQNCHVCDRYECCDNRSPAVVKIESLIAACHATCRTIEFRGKVGMDEDLLPDESNWRDGVEPYLLALYNWNREVSGWSGGDMDEERWDELMKWSEDG